MLPDDIYITLNARRHRHITTKGWGLCVRWKDCSTNWKPLADMEEAYLVQTAEFAIANKSSIGIGIWYSAARSSQVVGELLNGLLVKVYQVLNVGDAFSLHLYDGRVGYTHLCFLLEEGRSLGGGQHHRLSCVSVG
jgi:hypothetical protein